MRRCRRLCGSRTRTRALPIGDRFAFELHQVVLGRDEDDEAITSCVVAQAEVPDGPAVTKIKGANKVKLLAALKEWKSANPDKEIISSIELARIAKTQGLDRHRKSEAVRGLDKDGVLIPTVGGHRLVLEAFST
jgi:hypothetical protein